MTGKSGIRRALIALFVLASLLAGPVEIVQACPNCKSAVAEHGDSMAVGYAVSIAIMLAVPAAIVAGWIIGLTRLMRALSRGQRSIAGSPVWRGD